MGWWWGLAALAAVGLAGCDGDSGFGPARGEAFLADLSPMHGVETNAIGVAVFVVRDGGLIEYALGGDSIAGITGVRLQDVSSGATIVPLFQRPEGTAPVQGEFASGTLTASVLNGSGLTLEELIDRFQTDGAVVLVDTREFPDGEIWGTVRPHVSGGASAPSPPVR